MQPLLRSLLQPVLSPLIGAINTGFRPSPVFNFSDQALFDPRITFTRASGAMRTKADGTLELVGNNVPRISYDSASGKMGLLIEEARTNLLTYSSQFDNAAWQKDLASITPNAVSAPDGTLTADKLVEDTSTNTHRCNQSVSGTTNTNPYTITVHAKKGERTKLRVSLVESTTFVRLAESIFDLDAGTYGAINAGGGATGSASIKSVGGGWYCCTLTATLGGTDGGIFCNLVSVTGTSTVSYTGDGTSGIYIWGAQLEAGSFPTSPIPTTTAAATRAADVALIDGVNFSSWYNQTEGTFVVSHQKAAASASSTRVLTVSDATGNENIRVNSALFGLGYAPSWQVVDGGVVQVNDSQTIALAFNQVHTSAAAYKVNDFAYTSDAAAVVTDASGSLPTVSRMNIGSNDLGAGNFFNGHIFSLRFYAARLSNAQLVALSAL